MKILKYESDGKHVEIIFIKDNKLQVATVVDGGRSKDEIITDAIVLTKNLAGHDVLLEDYELPVPKLVRMTVDFNELTITPYDQYGNTLDIEYSFIIEGTDKARIEEGKIVEDAVEEDTSYFIVAKCGDLEEKQERTIYAPVVPQPSEADLLREELALTNQTLAELMLMLPMMQEMPEMPPLEDIPVDGELIETPITEDTTTEETTTEVPIDEPITEGGDI